MSDQSIIKQLIWDMACSASKQNVSPYSTSEYGKLADMGWRFTEYKNNNEWITDNTAEDQIMFTFMIYYSFD